MAHKKKTRLDMEALEDMLQLLREASAHTKAASGEVAWELGFLAELRKVTETWYDKTGDPELLRASRQCAEALTRVQKVYDAIDTTRELIWEIRARNYPQGLKEGMEDGAD